MVSSRLLDGAVHPDTQAVLLLCGNFARGGTSEARPLTLGEYNAVATWLARKGRRPADLLNSGDEPDPDEEPGLPAANRVRALLGRGFQMATALERWQRLGLWVVSRGEECYPERLRRTLWSASPALLFGAGNVSRLALGGLAVVGSRDTAEEGLSFTGRVAERCAAQGVQVISGGARGVDQAAVAAALEAGGGVVAVLADRLDRAATSRDAKEPLRQGRLTLISPYEPECGFTVGRAMGRNKDIYALADYSLVVRFATGAGGTWAGAVEQLGRNKRASVPLPLFVRVAHNPEDGVQDLRNNGALPFPEAEFWEGNIGEVLSHAAGPESSGLETTREPVVTPPPVATTAAAPEPVTASPSETAPLAAVTSAEDTCYSLCLPLLLRYIREGRPGKKQLAQIAKKMEIIPQQFNKWLERAIQEQKVGTVKEKNKIVYIDASVAGDTPLFKRGGDAA
jgi:predicted Rossmann fold nucleotide-binding protein DprA/Smf involved in DNA uptake